MFQSSLTVEHQAVNLSGLGSNPRAGAKTQRKEEAYVRNHYSHCITREQKGIDMKHPHTRSERRANREGYIKRRKFIFLTIQRNCRWNETPHEGDGYRYDHYIEYLNWIQASDDEKKFIEVEGILDRKAWQDPWEPPTWPTEVFSRYAKFNLTVSCPCCRNEGRFDRSHQRLQQKLRKQIEEEILEAEIHL